MKMFFVARAMGTAMKAFSIYDLLSTMGIRYRYKKWAQILFSIALGVLDATNICIQYEPGDPLFSNFLLLLIILVQEISISLFVTNSKRIAIRCVIFTWLWITYLDFAIMIVLYYLHPSMNFFIVGTVRSVYEWISAVAFALCIYLLGNLIKKDDTPWREVYNKSIFLSIAFVLVMPYFQRIYTIQMYDLPGDFFIHIAQWLMVTLVLMSGAIVYANVVKNQHNNEMIKKQAELLEEQYNNLELIYEEKSILVHDIKNHLRAIHEMTNDSNVTVYIENLMTGLNKRGMYHLTNHKFIDLIINSEMAKMEKEQIKFSGEADDLSEIILTNEEICALLSNILDNAIEAARKTQEKTIELRFKRKGQTLVIYLYNSCTNADSRVEDGNIIPYEVDRGSYHGFGLRSVRKIVRDHDGFMRYEVEKEKIVLTIMIQAFDTK
jgi:hypothetical protein